MFARSFVRHAAPVEELPHRRSDSNDTALTGEARGDLIKRYVRLLVYQPQDESRMSVQLRVLGLALSGRYATACRQLQSRPRNRRRLSNRKPEGRRSGRHPAYDRSDAPLAQIPAVGSARSRLPLDPAEAESACHAAVKPYGWCFREPAVARKETSRPYDGAACLAQSGGETCLRGGRKLFRRELGS